MTQWFSTLTSRFMNAGKDSLGPWRHGVLYLLLMLPFSVFRHIRIHGDEKVYVGQALEMLQSGYWFRQLQFGDVNYIKGPLHYILLILGHHAFGFSMLSTVYMNLILAAVAVVALRTACEYLFPKDHPLIALPAWAFASSGSFVLFSFSSQMDSELTSLYAIVMSLAVLARNRNTNLLYLLLWTAVGLAGTLKSPLHSCLLGVSVLAYFTLHRALFSQLFSSLPRMSFLVCGILTAGAGYLVPYFLDHEQWMATYIMREQVDRPRFKDPASGFLLNNFFLHFLPWSLLAFYALRHFYRSFKSKTLQWDDLQKAGLSFILPTFLFFFGLGYLAPWYGLPMLPATLLLFSGTLVQQEEPLKTVARALTPWPFVMIIAVLTAHFAFHNSTPWWSAWHTVATLFLFACAVAFFREVKLHRRIPQAAALFLGVLSFWSSTLILTSTLGEAELRDAHNFLNESGTAKLNYDNIKRENYNEWGYMAYMLGRPSDFSVTPQQLHEAALKGDILVFTSNDDFQSFGRWLDSENLGEQFRSRAEVKLWHRWPRNFAQMQSHWQSRLEAKTLWEKATRHFIMLKLRDTPEHTAH